MKLKINLTGSLLASCQWFLLALSAYGILKLTTDFRNYGVFLLPIALLYFLYNCIGGTMFLHRVMAHKHAVPKWVEKILTVLTIPMISGSPLGWVLVHRIHHINEDTENDPHSPLFKSTLWIHLMSITYLPKTIRPVTDLLKDKFQTKFHRVYVILCVVWLSSLFIILSVDHFALLVALPSTLTWHLGSSINSFGHSKKLLGPINSPILSMFTFGEGSHKNHHNDPRKLRFNASTVLDLGGYLLEKVVIKNVTK